MIAGIVLAVWAMLTKTKRLRIYKRSRGAATAYQEN
jgi:hypothetical protein